MAVVHRLEHQQPTVQVKHSETVGTYAIIEADGTRFLQIDTYGSAERKLSGKKSQSIRFGPEAIRQLAEIFRREFA